MIAVTPTEVERFWAKVERGDDCWLWTASAHGVSKSTVGHAQSGRTWKHLTSKATVAA